jgi:hypothetical protein
MISLSLPDVPLVVDTSNLYEENLSQLKNKIKNEIIFNVLTNLESKELNNTNLVSKQFYYISTKILAKRLEVVGIMSHAGLLPIHLTKNFKSEGGGPKFDSPEELKKLLLIHFSVIFELNSKNSDLDAEAKTKLKKLGSSYVSSLFLSRTLPEETRKSMLGYSNDQIIECFTGNNTVVISPFDIEANYNLFNNQIIGFKISKVTIKISTNSLIKDEEIIFVNIANNIFKNLEWL